MDPRAELLIQYGGDFMPGVVHRASGSWLEYADGSRVLDFTSGQICATVGHNHPHVVATIQRALADVLHLNSWMLGESVLALAERLVGLVPDPLDRVMFLSTGGEANEAALRIAKLHTGGFEVAGLTRGWHGMSTGSRAVTFTAAARRGIGPTQPGVFALPAPYAYRCPVRHCAGTCDSTCLEVGFDLLDQQSVGEPAAVIAEPVLSAGGVIVPPPGYFTRLLELCHDRGMLLVLDEAQTGLGRLGVTFGMELYGVVPDILVLSKTLGGGIPISAVVTTARVATTAQDRGFSFVTSHVSDPLPAAAAGAVLDLIEDHDLVGQAAQRGRHLQNRLRDLQERYECIGDVRGAGLLWGIELVADRATKEPANKLGGAVSDGCLRCGLSVNIVRGRADTNPSCLRLAPPLTVTDDEIDQGMDILDGVLRGNR